jgi:hypothetical protein
MPLPTTHSAAGVAGYLVFKKQHPHGSLKKEGFLLGLCLFLANFPGLDFMPGFLCGEPGIFHHGPSYSLLVNLSATLIFYRLLRNRLKKFQTRGSLVVFS